MAINPETQYPGKIAPADADYPFGSARNITLPGDGTGTPWEAAIVNDFLGFQQAILTLAGAVPSGNPDKVGASQYLAGVLAVSAQKFATVAAMKASTDVPAVSGATLFTHGYNNDFAAGLVPQGGATYTVTTLAEARTARGDPGWVVDEVGNHTLSNGLVAMINKIGPINVQQWGAWRGRTDNQVPINAALTEAAGLSDFEISDVYVPAERYPVSATIKVPEGVNFYGAGGVELGSKAATRIDAGAGQNFDMVWFEGHLDLGVWWWAGSIHDMAFFGEQLGASGNGLHFRDTAGNNVVPQDTTLLYNLTFRWLPGDGIRFTDGAVPLHVRDIKAKDCGGYAIRFTSITPTRAIGIHFDNISYDACALGGILVKDTDNTANLVFTNIKSETNTPNLQDYAIILDNCDRSSVSINGIHSQVNDDTVAPLDMVRIVGAGAPSVVWNAAAARLRSTAINPETSFVLNDTVTGRTFRSNQRQGQYNTLPVERRAISDISLAAGVGQTLQFPMVGMSSELIGVPMLVSLTKDYLGLIVGQGYMVVDEVVEARVQNFTGGAINIASVNAKILPVPDKYVKANASINWNPPQQLAGETASTTVTVPADLGDIVMFSHAADGQDTIGSAYVDAANSATVQLLNATAGTINIADALLTAYVLKDSAFRITNAVAYAGAAIADGGVDTITLVLPDAALGDFALASLDTDLLGVTVSAYVHTVGFVTISFQNETGALVNLPAATLKVGVVDTDQ